MILQCDRDDHGLDFSTDVKHGMPLPPAQDSDTPITTLPFRTRQRACQLYIELLVDFEGTVGVDALARGIEKLENEDSSHRSAPLAFAAGIVARVRGSDAPKEVAKELIGRVRAGGNAHPDTTLTKLEFVDCIALHRQSQRQSLPESFARVIGVRSQVQPALARAIDDSLERSGVQPGWVVTRLGSHWVEDAEDFKQRWAELKSGCQKSITVCFQAVDIASTDGTVTQTSLKASINEATKSAKHRKKCEALLFDGLTIVHKNSEKLEQLKNARADSKAKARDSLLCLSLFIV